ncbi:MAG: VWA domain-containing protein, partial [Myxococcales bacterium]|nr:VWA domain-containing protein [Myxococcales bacterium]
ALNTIRGAALPCVYQIPAPPDGRVLDFGLVNVEYTPGDGSDTITIPKVTGEADCPDDGNAWYYDDEAAPTQIILCTTTCDAIAVDLTAEVDIALGCQTIVR